MCIYLTHERGLTFDTQEHVIPAGIGGIEKLPKGYVSDQFNKNISVLETEFLRESMIASGRIFMGPGHRGKLATKHAVSSKVHVLAHTDGTFSLAYLRQSKQHIIPNIALHTKTGAITLGFANAVDMNISEAMASVIQKCADPQLLNIKNIAATNLPVDIIVLGFGAGIEGSHNAFLAAHPENAFALNDAMIKALGNSLSLEAQPQLGSDRPASRLSANWKPDYFRVFAKIAFNTLALMKGYDFLMRPLFDAIRSFIVYGGESDLIQMMTRKIDLAVEPPEDAHIVLLLKMEDSLYALVSLYNHFTVRVCLAQEFKESFKSSGLICDWKARKEERLAAFLTRKAVEISKQYQSGIDFDG